MQEGLYRPLWMALMWPLLSTEAAVLNTIGKIEYQSYNQPDKEKQPVVDSQFTHQVHVCQKTQYRNK